MTDPAHLEQQADQLRDLARSARSKAGALASHLDGVASSARDDTLWNGPYPTATTTTLNEYKRSVGAAADLLNEDATCWDTRAGQLDSEARHARAEQQKQDKPDGPR